MQTKWNIGGCGTECGSSGVTTTCPCEEYCDAGTVRQAYSVGGVVVYYESGADGDGCCVFRSDPYNVSICTGGGSHYMVMTLCGDTATVQVYQSSDDALVLQYGLVHSEAPTRDCSGWDSMMNAAYVWDGGTVIADCVYDVSAVTMSPASDTPEDCTDTPWEIPVGSGNCCPCPSGEPCSLLLERWNRADSTDLGDDWEEVAGDWEISSRRAVTTDSDAILRPTGMFIADVVKMVEVVCTGAQGDRIRLMSGYQDPDTYKFAEWEIGTGGFLRVGYRSGGTDTIVHTTFVDTAPGQYYRFRACGTAWLTAQLTGSAVNRYASGNVTGGSGTGLALGTGSAASDVRFAGLHVWRGTDDCVECIGYVPDCYTNCCPDDVLPTVAYLTINSTLTDSDCDHCNELANTYALDHAQAPHTTWAYACASDTCCYGYEEIACNSASYETTFGLNIPYRIVMSAKVTPTATPGVCKWTAYVYYYLQTAPLPGGFYISHTAVYESAEFSSATTCRGRFVLNKTNEAHGNNNPIFPTAKPCEGSFPSSVVLEVP